MYMASHLTQCVSASIEFGLFNIMARSLYGIMKVKLTEKTFDENHVFINIKELAIELSSLLW